MSRFHVTAARCCISVLLGLWVFGCGSTVEAPGQDVGLDLDVPGDVDGQDLDSQGKDLPKIDLVGFEGIAEDLGPDLGGKGGFGDPCIEAENCASGFCVEGFEGSLCTELCTESCAEGYSCRTVLNYFPDVISLCVPNQTQLCQPCLDDAQCFGGFCVPTPDGNFCTVDCSISDCPVTFECLPIELPELDLTMSACAPRNGSCLCRASSAGQLRTCQLSNDFGTCAGFEVCVPQEGWSNCNASEPRAEICNGVDEDCDGLIDEDLPASKACEVSVFGVGTCEGIALCAGSAGWVCNARTPTFESCDYLDNDCDGETDENYKGESGRYTSYEHCGACGNDCEDAIASAASVLCDVEAEFPVCVVEDCEPEYFKLNDYLCILPPDTFCKECDSDEDCFGNACLEIGGSSNCLKPCTAEDECMSGYSCDTYFGGASYCLPDNGTCDCDLDSDGFKKACSATSEHGTCFGFSQCSAGSGWLPCDARTPAVEICNGVDDDCNGIVDDALTPSACERTVADVGTCVGESVCFGSAGWVCTAPEPELDICDYKDNDCDGDTDEDFLNEHFHYQQFDHCGACNNSCDGTVPNGSSKCGEFGFYHRCIVDECDKGYYQFGDAACLPVSDFSCKPCHVNADCIIPGDRCVDYPDGSFCALDCGEGNLHLFEPGTCPDDFTCTADATGSHCVPSSGSCTCMSANDGDDRTCAIANEHGICFGEESCDPSAGWSECSAAAPASEICNGIDDDCNGLPDDLPGVGAVCGNTVADVGTCLGVSLCVDGHEELQCSAAIPEGERCDGLDNDCNGEVDETFPDRFESCSAGIGRCQRFGFYECLEDGSGTACNAEAAVAEDERCNNLDDDCDNETDEEWPGKGTPCSVGLGICQTFGVLSCDASAETSPLICSAEAGAATDEFCNGLDDNCDGDTDEGFVKGIACEVGVGRCARSGVRVCDLADPSAATICSATPGEATEELCNGLDDDCDGAIDETFVKGTACSVGLGQCRAYGVMNCDPTDPSAPSVCDAVPGGQSSESCDGLDNDCDGDVDELWTDKGLICEVGEGACKRTGIRICDMEEHFGPTVCDVSPGEEAPELCNGLDDNCNGSTDEIWSNLGKVCTLGTGTCLASGVFICDAQDPAGVSICDAEPGEGVEELCDGLDNDCDEETDEDWPTKGEICVVGSGSCEVIGILICDPEDEEAGLTCSVEAGGETQEICDGLDNDCDGDTDEDWPDRGDICEVSVGVCSATGTKRCDPQDPAGPTVCNATAGDGGDEVCDGIDNDCDSLTDEEWLDKGDICLVGTGVCRATGVRVCNSGDPAAPTICGAQAGQPGDEICDGLDNDCDGSSDEEWLDKGNICTVGTGICRTTGVRVCNAAAPLGPTVCDVEPGAEELEICDGLDNNCNGSTDEAWLDKGAVCSVGTGTCVRTGTKICDIQAPSGLTVCSASPGDEVTETCDGLDNDCDGLTDEGWPLKGTVCYEGIGACRVGGVYVCDVDNPSADVVCSAMAGETTLEACDGLDNDCDGSTDEEGALGCLPHYYDGDNDGYGLGSDTRCLCSTDPLVVAGNYDATTDNDCDDNEPLVNPGRSEVCDGLVDQDCDGVTDNGCNDDGDQYCDGALATTGRPALCPKGGGDCDDLDPAVNPGASEICDGMDGNCNAVIDEGCDDDDDDYCDVTLATQADPQTSAWPAVCPLGPGDCRDSDAAIRPGADEICNGLDDDCDGETDEGFEKSVACQVGVGRCARSGVRVCDPGDSSAATICNVTPGEPVDELCNGLDDDCDEAIDETFVKGAPCSEGLGQCRTYGVMVCDPGDPAAPSICDAVPGDESPEICDGVDNDCDGTIDELWSDKGAICVVGEGACERTGTRICDSAAPLGPTVCDVSPGAQAPELCNGLDDNCNGSTDEPWSTLGDVCTLGTGVCLASGVRICDPQNPSGVSICDATPGAGGAELCDALDNNCNGETDEDWPTKGQICVVGSGSCEATGTLICDPADGENGLICSVDPGSEGTEICDGLDNDCDDLTDEDWPDRGEICEVSVGACSATGTRGCDPQDPAGPTICNATAGDGGDEVCDGVDNDCDSLTDEEWLDKGDICTVGTGVCRATGVRVCNSGAPAEPTVCGAQAGQPGDEICDGLDNDCDGSTDEEWLNKGSICTVGTGICHATGVRVCDAAEPSGPTVCDAVLGDAGLEVCDGLDNNCDGTTDEAWLDKGSVCSVGTGACTRSGIKICDPHAPSGLTVCSASPGDEADETCDGLDNDCDGLTDEGWPLKGSVCYAGVGSCRAGGVYECDPDHPSAGVICSAVAGETTLEACDGLDNDCDESTDEEDALGCAPHYYDGDNDGYGLATDTRCLCSTDPLVVSGSYDTTLDGDCDDDAPLVNPGRAEICDGLVDEDCDGATDEGCNDDGDDYCDGDMATAGKPAVCAKGGGDCDDGNPDVNPGALEICDDLDGNCNAVVDEGCDDDDDEYCDATLVTQQDPVSSDWPSACPLGPGDCRDGDPSIRPDATETCDGRDNDCDDEVDETWPEKGDVCWEGLGLCRNAGVMVCDLVDSSQTTCNAVPADTAPETCDGLDNDCDGVDDNGLTPRPCVASNDDGECDGTETCMASQGWSCDAPTPFPESCDYVDNDCDGLTDEGFVDGAGRYVTFGDCGACGTDCAVGFPHATETACDTVASFPECRVVTCAVGYFKLNDTQCAPNVAKLCDPCVLDENCIVDGAKCIDVGSGETFCGLPCTTQGDCDAQVSGFVCTDFEGTKQCIPATGSCSCNGEVLGLTDSCFEEYDPPDGPAYKCFGLRTCEEAGWTTCELPELCNLVDDDCDGLVDEGFVDGSGAYVSDTDCGQCGNDCTLLELAGAAGICNATVDPVRCGPVCLTGFYDLDGNPNDCECEFASDVDFPDPLGLDANCDGIDGELDEGIFVARFGDDADPGTIDAPKRTIQAGIDTAAAEGRRDVYVSAGVYSETIALAIGVGTYGGYSADFRERNQDLHESAILATSPDESGPGAVNAIDIAGADAGSTVFDGFSVFAYDQPIAGASSYAVYVRDSDESLRISNNTLTGGLGGKGSRGTDGVDGDDGSNGTPGVASFDLYLYFQAIDPGYEVDHCDAIPPGEVQPVSAGGAGGVFSCDTLVVSGGSGGERVCPSIDAETTQPAAPIPSEFGLAGSNNSVGGDGGAPGQDVYHQSYSCDGYSSYGSVEGEIGLDGDDGSNGNSGGGCTETDGTIDAGGLWQASVGTAGTRGTPGGGGGGGGSGGGAYVHTSCFSKGFGYDNYGGTGGGAGSGACDGSEGTPGTSGGGAFVVFFVATVPPSTVPDISYNSLHSGYGGDGGDGGNGGVGGAGGLGAPGGAGGGGYDPPEETYPAFKGGKGGTGGQGGHGGGGGGGCGGPSYGIFATGAGGADLNPWKLLNSFDANGSGGASGLGGFSLGNPGGDGSAGESSAANF